MLGKEEEKMFSHKMKRNYYKSYNNNNNNHNNKIKTNISSSWSQLFCLVLSVSCCMAHSAFGQLPSALITTTIPPSSTTKTITNTTTIAAPRVIVESIAVDEHRTSIGVVDLPHAFRHQQHYSHRIEQAVNDFEQQQQQQQQHESHLKERDKKTNVLLTTNGLSTHKNNNNNNNKNKNNNNNNKIDNRNHTRYQHSTQWQDQQHHQRRHEHHWLQQHEQNQEKHELNHLRHRHHYASAWDQHNIPSLRHQHHRNAFTTTKTSTIKKSTIQQPTTEAGNELDGDKVDNGEYRNKEIGNLRLHVLGSMLSSATNSTNSHATRRYFDRQPSLLSAPDRQQQQPVTRGPLISRVPSTRGPRKFHHQRIREYSKFHNIIHADESKEGLSGQRLSLKLHKEGIEDDNVHDEIAGDFVHELDYNDDDTDDDNIDNYSYEDDSDNESNENFSASTELIPDHKQVKDFNQIPIGKPPVKRFTNPFRSFFKSFHATEPKFKANSHNDENISDEKLRFRVQQHHIRQQQHQHELEAMRSMHGGLAANMVSSGPNKHNTNNQASHLVAHY